jgi:hypothetical protein
MAHKERIRQSLIKTRHLVDQALKHLHRDLHVWPLVDEAHDTLDLLHRQMDEGILQYQGYDPKYRLTTQQRKALQFIREHTINGRPPSNAEISQHLRHQYPMTTANFLFRLERRGFIKRIRLNGSKAAPRSIQITTPVDAFIRK